LTKNVLVSAVLFYPKELIIFSPVDTYIQWCNPDLRTNISSFREDLRKKKFHKDISAFFAHSINCVGVFLCTFPARKCSTYTH